MNGIIFEERNENLELISFFQGSGVFAFCLLETSIFVYHVERDFETYFKNQKHKMIYLKHLAKSLGFKNLSDIFVKTTLIAEDDNEYEIYMIADKIVSATAYDENHSKVIFDTNGKRVELLVRDNIVDLFRQMW